MTEYNALDCFCGAGGSAMGLHRAGFRLFGIDCADQPSYPFARKMASALIILRRLIAGEEIGFSDDMRSKPHVMTLDSFNLIWASPPCQKNSWAARRWLNAGWVYVDHIEELRKLLIETRKPYIMENVAGAKLIDPVMLCGGMFGLEIVRHRYFESNMKLIAPEHDKNCRGRIARGEAFTVAGHGGNSKSCKIDDHRRAMGIDWMDKREKNYGDKIFPGNREDLNEAIPPAYSEYLGKQFFEQLVIK